MSFLAELRREGLIAPNTARRMDRLLLVIVSLALGYFAFEKFALRSALTTLSGCANAG